MASKNNSKVISTAHPHTIKKFELIEEYIKSWAQKLMLTDSCNTLVFIDCMCNSGIYIDSETKQKIEGTPVRVAKVLLEVAKTYRHKEVQIYLNDIDAAKIEELRKHLPTDERNFRVITHVGDASDFLKAIGPQLRPDNHLHYFLLYDPYDASIDWEALYPFFRNWGEVLINHMVFDPARAITCVKRTTTMKKYEHTYREEFNNLVPYGSDKQAYENRIEEIIKYLKGNRRYFVSAFPFYNSQNTQIYSLVHCTSNPEGFKLYKSCAWKVFGGQSSTKRMNGSQNQLTFELDADSTGQLSVPTDESCFTISDIAKYLRREFSGRKNVSPDELWHLLDNHPVFPSDRFKTEIKNELKNIYGVTQTMSYNPQKGKREQLLSFK